MTTAKFKKLLTTALMVVGAFFVATAAIRADKSAKASGTSFTKALADQFKILTQTA